MNGTNGDSSLPSKPAAKPPKGIMGMFGNKPASKNQESSKEVKSEQKEDAPAVGLRVFLGVNDWLSSCRVNVCRCE